MTRAHGGADRLLVDVVALDLDGTMADTASDIATAANEVLHGFHLPQVSVSHVRSQIGGGVEGLIRGLLGAYPDIPLDIAATRFRKAYAACCCEQTELYPGVAEVLDCLASMGIRMAVVTNKAEVISRPLMDRLGIAHHFFLVVGPESVSRRKPDPEMLTLVLRTANVLPSRTLIVGDHPSDIECGQSAKTLTCAVTYGYASPTDLARATPDFTIARFGELLDIVRAPSRP